jgi:hypothetical protein
MPCDAIAHVDAVVSIENPMNTHEDPAASAALNTGSSAMRPVDESAARTVTLTYFFVQNQSQFAQHFNVTSSVASVIIVDIRLAHPRLSTFPLLTILWLSHDVPVDSELCPAFG